MENHRDHAKKSDAPIAALLADLKARGLFDDTLVIGAASSAGPRPRALQGRDHHNTGFTMWLAGGGVKQGHISHGSTDEFG